jgi:GDPmannose 4,6-dehydratase
LPKALITGITGQDGSYLAEFLLEKGYEVVGLVRRTSTINFSRIEHIQDKISLVSGDMLDQISLTQAIEEHRPDEVYNLAAQSFVQTSWRQPVFTGGVTALGVTRLLDAIRTVDPSIRYYQASSSEQFGKVREVPQTEATPFYPRSPYGVAKVYGHWITINYRESYDLHATCGILFNHESATSKTPVIIRRDGLVDILPIGDIKPAREKGRSKQTSDVRDWGLEVWDGDRFVNVKTITATHHAPVKNNKGIRMVVSRGGAFEVTRDHVVITADDEVPAGELEPGDRLELVGLPAPTCESDLTHSEATLLGLFVADGSAYLGSGHHRGRFTNNAPEIRQMFTELWKRVTLGYTSEASNPSGFEGGSEVHYLNLNGASTYLARLVQECYTRERQKRVPARVLNASPDLWESFLRGYNIGDGLKAGGPTHEFKNFKTNSPTLALGLWWIVTIALRQGITLNVDWHNGKPYYSMNLRSPHPNNKGQHLRRDPHEIKAIYELEDYEGWLYDLETGSGTFHAGVGLCHIHNSPRRGLEFVTRKIAHSVASIKLGLTDKLALGNMDAQRDWGFAGDYVRAMWMMLQQDQPDDYVIATGRTHTVERLCEVAFEYLNLDWHDYVYQDPRFMRPAEVDLLVGDASKAKRILGWELDVSFEELIHMMVDADLERLKKGEKVR